MDGWMDGWDGIALYVFVREAEKLFCVRLNGGEGGEVI